MSKERNIILDDGKFILDDKPYFIYSGEIHYFRTPYNMWRKYLKKAKQAGLNTVSTYIPWRWHEYKQGKFDFTGRTKKERNLLAFLDMTEEEDMYLFLRPGPICHGEIKDGGLPGWLIDNYPQVLQRDAEGSSEDRMRISFSNPTYLEFVKKWYEKIIPIIAKRQVTNSSNVIIVQLDNEIGMINWLCKEPDYNKKTKRLYQEFLKKKYHSIKDLNKLYSSKYKNFSEIKFILSSYDSQPGLKYWDWTAFWREFYADYFEYLAKIARSLGIEVPVVADIAQFADFDVCGRGIYSPMTSSMFCEFPKRISKLVIGGAYQMRRLDYANFHDVAVATEIVKMISDNKSPSICCELQTGIMYDRPKLYPSDVDLNIFTSCAHGLNGLNAYMFASGKNPPEIGALGSRHTWQAAVDLRGKPRPHYEPMKRWGRIFKTFGESLALSKKEYDITVGFYMPYYETDYLKGEFKNKLESTRDKFFFDGICRLLELAGYNFKIIDIQSAELENEKNLFVFCLDFMDRKTQKKLVNYVIKGGKLIIGPNLPSKDLGAKNYNYLSNKLNLKFKPDKDEFISDGKNLMTSEGKINTFKTKEKEALFKTDKGNISAIFKKVNKGNVVAYGFGLTHRFNYHIDIMQTFLNKMKIKSRVKNNDREIQTVLRSNERGSFLFVANYHQLDKKVKLSVEDISKGKKIKIPDRGSFTLTARNCRVLPINYQITDGVKLIKTTAQILNISKKKNKISLKVEGTPACNEEIVFDIKRLKSVKINRKKITPQCKAGLHFIRFKPGSFMNSIEFNLKK